MKTFCSFIFIVFCLSTNIFSQVQFSPHTITTGADRATSVYAFDLDDDGDIDVLSASRNDNKIVWYENDGNEIFTPNTITTNANGAYSVYPIDVDDDEDTDVLSASYDDNTIAWYENDGNENFTTHIITTGTIGALSVCAIDVDDDGDMDVLSASRLDNKIAWYENDGNENFTSHTITTNANGAASVYAVDMDEEGDIDVLSASINDNKITWYENDGNENYTTHTITTGAGGAHSVYAVDVDGDGDIDVLSASAYDNKISWYENDGNENFATHTITTDAVYATSVYAIDVDGDGDIDVLSASCGDDKIAWYENDGNENFTSHFITTSVDEARSIYAEDVDGDGDIDVLSASLGDDKIVWYENRGVAVDNLVAFYPFNGNANDESGNNLHLTPVGSPTLSPDRFGNEDKAYYFDGQNDFFIHNYDTLLTPTTEITVNAWVKHFGVDGASDVVVSTFDIPNVGGYQIDLSWPHQEVISWDVRPSSSGLDIHIPYEQQWKGNWTMITGTFNQYIMKLFVNGELKDSLNTNILINYEPTNDFRIGTNPHENNENRRFKGYIDDTRIYNVALTQTEILELYHEGGWPGGNGLVAYYPFNGNANDESGNGNDGNVYGASLTTDRFGNSNSAYYFDGIDDYIDIINPSFPFQNTSRTMSAWIKTNSVQEGAVIMEYGLLEELRRFGELIHLNKNYFVCQGPDIYGNVFLLDNKWHNFVVTYDGVTVKLYVNGVFDTDGDRTLNTGNSNARIGRAIVQPLNPNYQGKLDDIRIYDRALGEAEILELYHEGGWGTNNTISVLTPNGGEVWGMSTEQFITWSSIDIIDVKIDFSSNNGASWELVNESVPSTGIYSWNVPAVHTIQGLIKISDVTDENVFDISDGVFTIEPVTTADMFNSTIPDQFELKQNYPNPFNPTTIIYYGLPEASSVSIKIFDILGKELMSFFEEEQVAGYHNLNFEASNLPSGIYFYRLQAGSFVETKKMVLMK